ncbi:hypothetical protein JHK85_025128 [Glycine max]|nr:hypothetical protein JHK85_025128 [Glycine max]
MSPPPTESNAMEDGKPMNGSDQVGSCFVEFCKNGLALEEKSCKEAKNLFDFFKELPQFVVKAGPTLSNLYGIDWENRLEIDNKILMVTKKEGFLHKNHVDVESKRQLLKQQMLFDNHQRDIQVGSS